MSVGRPSTRLLVEGFVIVVSILLAFGIDAAWQERGERRSERLALQALHAEAVANRQLLETVVDRVRSDIARAEEFYDLPLAELESALADDRPWVINLPIPETDMVFPMVAPGGANRDMIMGDA